MPDKLLVRNPEPTKEQKPTRQRTQKHENKPNTLRKMDDYVVLVEFPRFTKAGWYTWEVQ